MTILSDDQIRRLHAVIVATRLTGSRRALLGGIAPTLVDALPDAENPSSQTMSDLYALNSVERLRDGSVPLKTLMENALALSEQLAEAGIIRELLKNVDRFDEPKANARPNALCEGAVKDHCDASATTDDGLSVSQAPVAIIRKEYSSEYRTSLVLLRDYPFRVGRSGAMNWAVDHLNVSRFHASFVRDGHRFLIVDNRAANGTMVNGLPVSEFLLRDGDCLSFGTMRAGYYQSYASLGEALEELRQNGLRHPPPTEPWFVADKIREDSDVRLNYNHAVRRVLDCDPRCSIFLVSVDCSDSIERVHGRAGIRAVLMTLAKVLSFGLPSNMLLAETGSEMSEMALVVPGVCSQKEADNLICTIRGLVPESVSASLGFRFRFTVTIGSAPMHIEDARRDLEARRASAPQH